MYNFMYGFEALWNHTFLGYIVGMLCLAILGSVILFSLMLAFALVRGIIAYLGG